MSFPVVDPSKQQRSSTQAKALGNRYRACRVKVKPMKDRLRRIGKRWADIDFDRRDRTRLTVALHHAINTGNLQSAQALQERLNPLFQALERDHIVPALKYGLCLLRGMGDDVRLPLTPIVAETAAAIRMALAPVLCRPTGLSKQLGQARQ